MSSGICADVMKEATVQNRNLRYADVERSLQCPARPLSTSGMKVHGRSTEGHGKTDVVLRLSMGYEVHIHSIKYLA